MLKRLMMALALLPLAACTSSTGALQPVTDQERALVSRLPASEGALPPPTAPGEAAPATLPPQPTVQAQAPAPAPAPIQAQAQALGQSVARVQPQPAAPRQPVRTNARIRFEPVVGAPQAASQSLAGALTALAGQRGIVLQPVAASATHVVRGYFSAFTDGPATTIVFVWDVLDQDGTRLHRIQGQQRIDGATGQGWNAVTPQAMNSIAARTIDELAVWLQSSGA